MPGINNIPASWTFKDQHVAEGFDHHVREQLPWYDLVTQVVCHFARHYLPPGSTILDLGCSTGNIARNLKQEILSRNLDFIGFDNSDEILKCYDAPGRVVNVDLESEKFVPPRFHVAVCFLSLMFLSIAGRARLLAALKRSAEKGGAIIIIDKMESSGGYVGTILSRLSLSQKINTGVPPKEILEKELSLVGIQRPLKTFEVDGGREFFRFGDFAGWIFET